MPSTLATAGDSPLLGTFGTADLKTEGAEFYAAAWSPAGRRLAVGGRDRGGAIVAVSTWRGGDRTDRRFSPGGGCVLALAWHPRGKILATGGDRRGICLWNVGARAPFGQLSHELAGHTAFVRALAYSPDAALLASGSNDGTARVWDGAAGHPVATLEGHAGGVLAVAWSPDGKLLATASDDWSVRVWDVADGDCVGEHFHHGAWVRALAWSPNGSLASGDEAGSILLWDAPDGLPRPSDAALPTPSGPVWSLAWSPDGRTLAAIRGRFVGLIWEGAGIDWPKLPFNDTQGGLAWAPRGRKLAAAFRAGGVRAGTVRR
jgi:WD40 repeat protein